MNTTQNLPSCVEIFKPIDATTGKPFAPGFMSLHLCTIEHPLDRNKILLFCGKNLKQSTSLSSGDRNVVVYSFDTTKHEFTYLNSTDDLDLRSPIIYPVAMLLELNKSPKSSGSDLIDETIFRIMVTGTTSVNCASVFHVYNVSQNKWESMSVVDGNSLGIVNLRPFTFEYKIGCQMISYKNYIIMTEGCDLQIYRVEWNINSKFYPSKVIVKCRLPRSYHWHSMLKIPNKHTKETINQEKISLILFGGENINRFPYTSKKKRRIKNSFCKVEILFDSRKDKATCKISDNPKEWIENIPNSIGELMCSRSHCHVVQSRYVIIFGMCDINQIHVFNNIVIFDMYTKQWKIYKNILPYLRNHDSMYSSIVCNQDKILYILSMCRVVRYIKIKLHQAVDWVQERIVWIGFYQNSTNDRCLIKTLPKDVIKFILSFLDHNTTLFSSK